MGITLNNYETSLSGRHTPTTTPMLLFDTVGMYDFDVQPGIIKAAQILHVVVGAFWKSLL